MEVGGHSKQKAECKKLRLTEAITTGRLYQTKMILEDTPNVNFVDEQGLSPLMRAFMIEDEKRRTRIAMVKLLLQHNAEVNLRNKEGSHALSLACRTNKLDLVKLLFEKCLHDIDLTSQDLEGNTPLMYAVINNNPTMVRLLVNAMRKFSLSVDQRNREDKTPYLKAIEMGFEECADILSEVGKASQGIKVNPFLDFLVIECRDNVRVSSAPVVKNCVRGGAVGRKHAAIPRRKNGCATMFLDGNRKTSNKKRNKLLKSRRVHSEASYFQKNQNVRKSASVDAGEVEIENVKGTGKNTSRRVADKVTILIEDSKRKNSDFSSRDSKDDNCVKNSREKSHSPTNGQDRLLWLILDGSGSETTNGRRSKSPMSCHSTNPGSRSISPANNTSPRCIIPSLNNFLDRQGVPRSNFQCSHSVVSRFQESPTRDFENNSTKNNSSYYAYLEWKASVDDQSPNSLRNLLALRAEQQSGLSSYRKGLVLPKYDPKADEVGEDRSAGVVSPISERSGRSEAARKISAVARTVGLSVYLSNRRKWSKKES